MTGHRLRNAASRIDPGLLLAGLLTLFAVYPFLSPGLPNVADSIIHVLRTVELDQCWRDGVFYPRWAPNLALGYGYPLFDFAPPLPYFVPQVLHTLGFELDTAMKLLVIGSFVLYSVGMYLFARDVLGRGPALLAAAAYVYTPFRLREALIYGGNWPQFLAIALFPWNLWAFRRWMRTGRPAYLALSVLSYGALLLSHLFHALIFTPLLLAYVLFLWATGSQRTWRELARPALALALALALTAFFWVPAFVERQWTRAQAHVYLGKSPFYLRFLSWRELLSPPVPPDTAVANPYVPFSLGAVIVGLAALGLLAALFRGTREARQHAAFFVPALLAVVFMMLPASAPLWQNVPWLALGEFPWRLLGLANLACAFLAGASLGPWRRATAPLLLTLLAVLVASFVYLYPIRPFIRLGTPTPADAIRHELGTGAIGTTTLAEYLPLWATEVPHTSPLVAAYLEGRPIEKLDRASLPASARAEQLEHTAVSDRYRIATDRPFAARFNTFYFPGWRATVDGQPATITITDPEGLIEVAVPAGEHEVALRFGETPFRLAMDGLSVVAGVALLLILWRAGKPGFPPKKPLSVLSRRQALAVAFTLLALLAVKALYVDPHTRWFRRHSPPQGVIGVQHPVRANLGDRVLLRGYDLSAGTLRQGDTLALRMYWEAQRRLDTDYSVFAHLDAPPDGRTLAGSDNIHPGDARAQIDVPTSTWQPGLYVRDEHRLAVPADLPPVAYTLRVGLYDRQSGERLPVLNEDGTVSSDGVALQTVHVTRRRPLKASRLPHRVEYALGERIELLGYDVNVGDALELTLYWRARQPVPGDYTVFVHVVDGAGELRGQKDGPPMDGMYPTSKWLVGQIVEDRRVIPLDGAPGGGYRVLVGMYDPASLRRLAATDAAGQRLPDDAIPLIEGLDNR